MEFFDPALIVARKEFLGIVRSRWFAFSTALPIAMLVLLILASRGLHVSAPSGGTLVLVDETGSIQKTFTTQFKRSGPAGLEVEPANINKLAPAETILEQLHRRTAEGQIAAYVHIPRDFVAQGNARLFTRGKMDTETRGRIEAALTAALRDRRLQESGIEAAKLSKLTASAKVEASAIQSSGSAPASPEYFPLARLLAVLLYACISSYGLAIGRSVVEEKTSRIVEVMLGTVRPIALLAGKVLGVGVAGLLQMSLWCLALLICLIAGRAEWGPLRDSIFSSGMPAFPPSLLAHFILWFLLGYFLYAFLYAALAAMAGSERDLHQLHFPATLLQILPIMLQGMIVASPGGSLARTLSFIPFFAPVTMFTRTAVLTPPRGEMALAMLITFGAILLMLGLAARIYRIGILSYGKRPSPGEMIRWVVRGY